MNKHPYINSVVQSVKINGKPTFFQYEHTSYPEKLRFMQDFLKKKRLHNDHFHYLGHQLHVAELNTKGLAEDPSNLTIVLHEEDHTIGNSLKHILCGMENVEFCGYNVPHPLEDKILLRLQTKKGINAVPILLEAFSQLEAVFASMREKFEQKYNDSLV